VFDTALNLNLAEVASITKGVTINALLQLKWHATSFMLGVLSEASYSKVAKSPLYTEVLKPAGFNYVKDISVQVDLLSFKVFLKPVVDAQCTVLSSSNDIIVAVRGSENPSLDKYADWIMTNLDFFDQPTPVSFPEPFSSSSLKAWPYNFAARVHPGFHEAADALLPEVQASINIACSQNPLASKVWFTGHSMGGAVAILLAALLQDSNFIAPAASSTTGSHTCGQKLQIAGVFGFQSPMPGDATFATHYFNIGLGSQTLVHAYGEDPVPRLPLTPYNHAGALVLTRRSLANPDITMVTGPGPAGILGSSLLESLNFLALGDHTAGYWLPPLRNLASASCDAAAAKLVVASCPDFAKLAAYVVAKRDEVAEISGRVYYLDTDGRQQAPNGVFTVTCYDYDFPPTDLDALVVSDRDTMCTTNGVNGIFRCRYHRRIRMIWNLGAWDVFTRGLPPDTSQQQTWPDIECDIKPPTFPTGTYTGRLSTDELRIEYNAGAIELNPDRSAACNPNGCGPSGDLWLVGIPNDYLVPDTWFLLSCGNHDCCYATCGTTQQHCDDEFLRNMNWECYQLKTAAERKLCWEAAPLYQKAVKKFGESAFKTAQMENFCVGPSASTAAISGKVKFSGVLSDVLKGATVTCYDMDTAFDDVMCMAKTGNDGSFKCYYFKKSDGETWDDITGFEGPDVGCSVLPAKDALVTFEGPTEVLGLTEDSKEGDIDVGTLVVTASGKFFKQ
jgi:hypothetical protein